MKKNILLITFVSFSIAVNAQNCGYTFAIFSGTGLTAFMADSSYPDSLNNFQWDFGDGSTSSGSKVTHWFNSMLDHEVCLEIYDTNNALVCNYCDTIVYHASGICQFTTDVGSTSNERLFYGFPGPNTTNTFDFGDGTIFNGDTTAHTFAEKRTYYITCTQVDTLTFDSCVSTYYFTVFDIGNCAVGFLADTSNTVLFTTSPTGLHAVMWDFGDGTTDTGQTLNHTFPGAGNYWVCYSAIDLLGNNCSACYFISLRTTQLYSSYTSATANGITTLRVYQKLNTDDIITYEFEDGSTTVGDTIQHVFTTPGNHFVCMNETDSVGNLLSQFSNYIFIGNTAATCSFVSIPDTNNPLSYNFYLNYSQFINVQWDFGDNSSDTGLTVSHQYSSPGIYNACVDIDSLGVNICHSCAWIHAGTQPANCQASFYAYNQGSTTYFIDLSVIDPGTAATYNWDFGDGTTSANRFPNHTYTPFDTNTVCLIIDDGICIDTFCNTIIADTTAITGLGCNAFYAIVSMAPYDITIVNLSSGTGLHYLWNYGDGNQDTLPYPSHTYAATGNYNLCLTVSDPLGCVNTFCDSLNVDSLGYIYRAFNQGFIIHAVSPGQLTAINDGKIANQFYAYPNPVISDFHVSVSSGKHSLKLIRVFSIQGLEVINKKVFGREATISTDHLSKGVYLIEVSFTDGSRRFSRIIME
jgi:PKD repeat protein